MKNITLFLLTIAFFSSSCKSVKNIFGNVTPHEKYAKKLEDKHLEDSPEGRQWLAVSVKALDDAQKIELPYRQTGYFHSDKPHALGLMFKANIGERITFNVAKNAKTRFTIFADLFKQNDKKTALLASDTSTSEFSFDIAQTGIYILRLQPKLFDIGEYALSVSVGPSLGFPVVGNKANVGSYWGENRDGGKRSHEGIDIFAPRLTPTVAGADGIITGVKEGGLGGKQVWLKVNDRDAFLYYAHLDKQLVQQGQAVKKGDVVGLVGNTGNAAHTPSHLHFGVYTSDGPVNPYPFVNRSIKTAPNLPFKNLSGLLTLIKSQKTPEGNLIKANTELVPLAANAIGYIAELPNGDIIQTSFASVRVSPVAARQIPTASAGGAR